MTIEHRRNLNMSNLRQKEVKLNKLIDQVKIRDEYIANAKNELNKKGVKLKQPDEIKPIENLNIEHSYVLPVIISPNPKADLNFISPHTAKMNSPNRNDLNNSGSRSPYEAYNNPNIIKEKKKFKSKTTEIIEKAKKNELSDMKLNVINELYPNSKIYYLNSNTADRRLSQGKLRNIIAFDTKNLNQSFDRGNTSINSKTSDISRSASRIREREVDKKVKNILLKKNIVGRHKNSPYLKNFNKL